MSAPEFPEFLSVAEAAKACRTTPQTIRRWIRAGRIKAVQPFHVILVPVAEIRRLLAIPADVDGAK